MAVSLEELEQEVAELKQQVKLLKEFMMNHIKVKAELKAFKEKINDF